MIVQRLTSCPVCGSSAYSSILDLPAFPLTGIYVDDPATPAYKADQSLLLCDDCGHGYLGNILDPSLLYEKTYTHRTGGSPMARASNDVFWNFIQKVGGQRRFTCALEIGCNDLYLMEKLSGIAERAVGIDPVWRDLPPPSSSTNVRVIGKFITEINPVDDFESPPDLIVSSHTFEHLSHPFEQFKPVVDAAARNAVIIIAVPGFEALLSDYRFDHVFHQHIQYFTPASLLRMAERLGCRYLAHAVDYHCWGGTLMLAFTKNSHSSVTPSFRKPLGSDAVNCVRVFKERYRVYAEEIENYDGVLYGFGAAQMIPTIAYHLGPSLQRLKAFLDDNPDRIGRYFPGLPIPIVKPSTVADMDDAGVVITALDSSRPIMQRLLQLNPRTIFYPLGKM